MTESFAQLFEESLTAQKLRPGALVDATVVAIHSNVVVVNAGLKSEGVIPIEQFRDENGVLEIAVGDQIEVAVETLEDGFGETRFSRERAKRVKAWQDLEGAYERGDLVSGIISGRVKGGFTVDIGAIRAFLPGTLVDIRPMREVGHLEGKTLDFKVIKLDRKRNNVVVSRRAVVEAEYSAEREQLLSSLEEGSAVKGIVKNLTDYGAFLDLGGVDGLLHITDMSWKRVKHPSEIVNVGDEITVRILKFDREKNRVSLGLKQMGEDPWVNLTRRYPPGSRLFGKVTNIADYGCFVEIEEGVEGLVHMSEMDWTNKNIHPSKVVHLGHEVEVMVLDIDEERRRISLGIKQCQPNPWEEFAANHSKGDRITGKIKSITDFGVFVGLNGGIDGLVHLSDIAWNVPGEEAVRQYKRGDEVTTIVLAVDAARERISLGIKQLEKDPFSNYIGEHSKGSVVQGSVKEVDVKSAVIELAEGVDGQLKASEFSREQKIEDLRNHLQPGQALEAKIISVDRKNRVVNLSVKAKEQAEEAEVMQDYRSGGGTASKSTTNLGDLLKEQFTNNEEEAS